MPVAIKNNHVLIVDFVLASAQDLHTNTFRLLTYALDDVAFFV
jgi:hypothetical protein